MFWQIFLSPQMKRSVIVINIHGIYELPHELPNNLRNITKISKLHRMIAQCPIPLPKWKFCQYQQKTLKKQKLNLSLSALFHMKTRICIKYLSTIVGRLTSRVLELSYTFFSFFLIFSVCSNFFFLFQGKYLYIQKFNDFYKYLMNFINCQK